MPPSGQWLSFESRTSLIKSRPLTLHKLCFCCLDNGEVCFSGCNNRHFKHWAKRKLYLLIYLCPRFNSLLTFYSSCVVTKHDATPRHSFLPYSAQIHPLNTLLFFFLGMFLFSLIFIEVSVLPLLQVRCNLLRHGLLYSFFL